MGGSSSKVTTATTTTKTVSRNMSGPAGKRLQPPLFGWKKGAGWESVEEEVKGGKEEVRDLSVISYNIWFSHMEQEKRYKKIISILLERNPHVACFQEVIQPFVELVCANKEIQENYYITEHPHNLYCRNRRHYGEMMLISKGLPCPQEVAFTEFECSGQGRRFLCANWDSDTNMPAIGTVHLESLNHFPERHQQLKTISEVLSPYPHALFMGDFNFDAYQDYGYKDGREKKDKIENEIHFEEAIPDYDDVWTLLPHDPEDKGYTFDSTVNKNIKVQANDAPGGGSSGEGEVWRIDRIAQKKTKKENKKGWVVQEMEVIGSEGFPVGNYEVWPSDHFGLFAKFKWGGE